MYRSLATTDLEVDIEEPPGKQAKRSESSVWEETAFHKAEVTGLEPYDNFGEADSTRDDDDGPDSEKEQWTALHLQAANPHNPPNSMPTPPQEDQAQPSSMDIDAVGPGGITPLHLAAMHGGIIQTGSGSESHEESAEKKCPRKNFVKELLELGADAGRATDTTAETPLHLAARLIVSVIL